MSLWGPVLLYMAGISYLSHQPRLDVPSAIPDWVLHGCEYAGLAVLLIRALKEEARGVTVKTGATAVVIALAFGCLDEFHQSFVPGRDPSLGDVVWDGAGALIVATMARVGWSGEPRASGTGRITITVFGRPGCHLCEEAEEAILLAGREFSIRLEKVNIDRDTALASQYSEQVPVVMINGRKWSKLRLDPERLHRKLSSMSREQSNG